MGEYLGPRRVRIGSGQGSTMSLYRSSNEFTVIKSRRLGRAGLVAGMEEGRSGFKILRIIPTGKRPLGSPRRR